MIASAVKSVLPQRLLRRRLPPEAGDAVLLTFDDGPTPGVTEGVLDRLDRYGARAVFFLVGRHVESTGDLAAEIVNRGHLLGNHSHEHDASLLPSPGAWLHDLRRCQDLVEARSGDDCLLYRAPEGRLSPWTLLLPPLCGLQHVQWSLDSGDWSCRSVAEAAEIGARTGEDAAPGDIILLHDSAPEIHDLLDELLPRLVARGLDLGRGVDLPGGAA